MDIAMSEYQEPAPVSTSGEVTATRQRFQTAILELDSAQAYKLALHLGVTPAAFPLGRGPDANRELFSTVFDDPARAQRIDTSTLQIEGMRTLWYGEFLDTHDFAALVSRLTRSDLEAFVADPSFAPLHFTLVPSMDTNHRSMLEAVRRAGTALTDFFLNRLPDIAYPEDAWDDAPPELTTEVLEHLLLHGRITTLAAMSLAVGRSPVGPRTWLNRKDLASNIRPSFTHEPSRVMLVNMLQGLLVPGRALSRRTMHADMLLAGTAFDWSPYPSLFDNVDMLAKTSTLPILRSRPRILGIVYACAFRQHALRNPRTPDEEQLDDAHESPDSSAPEVLHATRRSARAPAPIPIDPALSSESSLVRDTLNGESSDILKRLAIHRNLWARHAHKRFDRGDILDDLEAHYHGRTPDDIAELIEHLDGVKASLALATRATRSAPDDPEPAPPASDLPASAAPIPEQVDATARMQALTTAELRTILSQVSEKPENPALTRDSLITDLLTRAGKQKTRGWRALRDHLVAFITRRTQPPPASGSRPAAAAKQPLQVGGGGGNHGREQGGRNQGGREGTCQAQGSSHLIFLHDCTDTAQGVVSLLLHCGSPANFLEPSNLVLDIGSRGPPLRPCPDT